MASHTPSPRLVQPATFASALSRLETPEDPAEVVSDWVYRLSHVSTAESTTDMPTTPTDGGYDAAIFAPLTTTFEPIASLEQREAFTALQNLQNTDHDGSAVGEETNANNTAHQTNQTNQPQDGQQSTIDANIDPNVDPEVSQLHLAIHERLQIQRATQQRSRRTIAGVSVPWPRRWGGSLQWRQQQQQTARPQLWESFDGSNGTLGATGGLTAGFTTGITRQLCEDLSATHQVAITANFAGTTGATVAPPVAASAAAAAANKKKDSKRSKILGDMGDIPARWKWFLNPRETVLDWAKSEAHNKKRQKRKQEKKIKAAKRKALKALKEQEAQVVQQSVSVDVYGPGAATGEDGSEVANEGARTVVQRLEEEARARAAAALGPVPGSDEANAAASSQVAASEVIIESEAFATVTPTAPRLVTQYGRVWVRPKTMYGEEGSVAATGDGATSNGAQESDNDNDNASSDYENGREAVVASPPPCRSCGVTAPPNSVADSGYGQMEAPVVFEEADGSSSPVQLLSLALVSRSETELPSVTGIRARTRCRCRLPGVSSVGGVDGVVEGPTIHRCSLARRQSTSVDDARSFVTCLSRPW